MTILITLLVLATLIITWVISVNNRIIILMNSVERAWAQVITQERQKNNIIPQIGKVVTEHKAFESSVQTHVAALRSALDDLSEKDIDVSKLAETQQKTGQLVQGLNVAVEAYPELKSSNLFINLINEITQQQEQVTAAIRIFNYNVERFNSAIEVFPDSIINGFTARKNKMNIFTDSVASGNFDYKPNFS